MQRATLCLLQLHSDSQVQLGDILLNYVDLKETPPQEVLIKGVPSSAAEKDHNHVDLDSLDYAQENVCPGSAILQAFEKKTHRGEVFFPLP